MRKIGLFYILLAFTVSVNAQRTDQAEKVDSMLKILAVSKEDTSKAMILLTLASW